MARPKVVFLVNGSEAGAIGIRARSFAERLADGSDIRIAYRSDSRVRAIGVFLRVLREVRPAVCYVFDMAYSGIVAATLYRAFHRCRVIVDTGDAVYQLAKSVGTRGRIGLALTWLLEEAGLRLADELVVRSNFHAELVSAKGYRATVIPDGVDPEQFTPSIDAASLRRRFGLEGVLTIGVLGSVIWNQRWQMCYGWELVDVLRLLKDEPVKGVLVGDGDGIEHLRARCEEYGISDKLVFLGRVPYEELPAVLKVMDVCLSTQTDDIPGRVRTTGKLPLYLAAGRYVLATQVGQAALVLPPEMLVPYRGTKDPEYPARLAERIRRILREGGVDASSNHKIAREHFSYDLLAQRLRPLLTCPD